MKPIIVTFLILLNTKAHADTTNYRAVQPIGTISKGSSIVLGTVGSKSTFFNPNQQDSTTESGFKTIPNDSLYKVKSIKNSNNSVDSQILKSLASDDNLVLSKSSLSTSDAGCVTTGSCTLTSDTPVYQASKFSFWDWLLNLFGLGGKSQSLVTPANKNDPKSAAAAAVNAKVTDTNKMLNGKDDQCSELPEYLKYDPKFRCGLDQAMLAYKTNKALGKVTSDTFIFNDFKDGGQTGKMYFFDSNGQLTKVLDKNPIPVARGVGGFGAGQNSKKTPNGAIVTRSYNPPRGGSLRDAVELVGLEPGNQDIFGRGVLLHGWNPYQETAGCLGIAGTLNVDGRIEQGAPPQYLDQLKQGLLKYGGVMIYNFTPDKAKACK